MPAPTPNWADQLRDVGEGNDLELPKDVSDKVEAQIATPETYDPRLVQDHTGLLRQAGIRERLLGQSAESVAHRIIAQGDVLICSRCGSNVFCVFCSSTDNFLQIVCGNVRCGAYYPVLEVLPPQMNDHIAAQHGILAPGELPKGGRRAPSTIRVV